MVAEVLVPDDMLSLAIGRKGQNVRLATKLTGWEIKIESVSHAFKSASGDEEEDPAIAGVREALLQGTSFERPKPKADTEKTDKTDPEASTVSDDQDKQEEPVEEAQVEETQADDTQTEAETDSSASIEEVKADLLEPEEIEPKIETDEPDEPDKADESDEQEETSSEESATVLEENEPLASSEDTLDQSDLEKEN